MTYFINDDEYTFSPHSHYCDQADMLMTQAQTAWDGGEAFTASAAFKEAGQYRTASTMGMPGMLIHFDQLTPHSIALGIAIFTHCADTLWSEMFEGRTDIPAPNKPETDDSKWTHLAHYIWMMDGLAKGEWPFAFSETAFTRIRKERHDQEMAYMQAQIRGICEERWPELKSRP